MKMNKVLKIGDMYGTKFVMTAKIEEANNIANRLNEISGVDIFNNTRQREYIEVRSLLNWYLKNVKNFTLHEIRDFYRANGKAYDHTTALHSVNSFESYKMYNKNFDKWLHKLNEFEQTDESIRTMIGYSLSILDTESLKKIQDHVIELKNRQEWMENESKSQASHDEYMLRVEQGI